MKQLRTIIVSMLAGALLATAGTTFGAETYKKISATLRPDLAVKVDGEKVKLQNAPLTYNGTTYVPLREAGQILGATVGYNAGTITIDSKEASKVSDKITEDWVSLRSLKDKAVITLGPDEGRDNVLTITANGNMLKILDFVPVKEGQLGEYQVDGGGKITAKFADSSTYLKASDLREYGIIQ